MQVEAAVAGPQVQFVAFDDGGDMGSRAVQRQIEAAVSAGDEVKANSCAPIESVAGPLP